VQQKILFEIIQAS